jgi:hypothetical protein
MINCDALIIVCTSLYFIHILVFCQFVDGVVLHIELDAELVLPGVAQEKLGGDRGDLVARETSGGVRDQAARGQHRLLFGPVRHGQGHASLREENVRKRQKEKRTKSSAFLTNSGRVFLTIVG